MQEGGIMNLKHTRCAYILIAISLPTVLYLIYTYASENNVLYNKYNTLLIQMNTCNKLQHQNIKKNKILTNELKDLHVKNDQLTVRTFKQKNILSRLNSSHEDVNKKLSDAFKFYLDVKDLVADDQIVSEDRSIHEESSNSLMVMIKSLRTNANEVENLRKRDTRRKQELKDALTKNVALTKEVKESKKHYESLYESSKTKDKDLHSKDKEIEESKKVITDLQQTITKLKETAKQAEKHALTVKNETAQIYEKQNKEIKKKNELLAKQISKLMEIFRPTSTPTEV